MIAIPPFRAELGITLRFHAAAVRAMDRPIIVAHEPGMEALYPDVTKRLLVPTRCDDDRRWTYRHDQAFVDVWKKKLAGHTIIMPDKDNRLPVQTFDPQPLVKQRGSKHVDIVICPRKRRYGDTKNWAAWSIIVDRLVRKGLRVFSAGLEDTSFATPAQERAWDYARPLDATIEAMHSARVVLSTASGLSILALMCGAKLVLVTARGGLVAPGPAKDITGKIHHRKYWKIPLDYYTPLMHPNSTMMMVDGGWEDYRKVLRVVNAQLPVAHHA